MGFPLPSYAEALDSRSISTSGGKATGTRKFYVTGVATESDLKAVITAIDNGTSSLPKVGAAFIGGLNGLRRTDYSLTPIAGSGDAYDLVFNYEQTGAGRKLTSGFDPGDENRKLSGEIGFVEKTADIRSEFAPAYRLGVRYPILGLVTGDFEVGGYGVDAAGSPISIQRNLTEITVSEVATFSKTKVIQNVIQGLRFKRNNGLFLDRHAAGTVLYRGATIRRNGESSNLITHSFVQDSDFHLQQKVALDQDGEPILDQYYRAKFVYWVQPFNSLGNFGGLSDNF